MLVFKAKWFVRYARRERIGDQRLIEAIERAERGTVDADLGGGIIKQRIAREGQGRSSGKSEQDNIRDDQLETLREIGATWLEADMNRLEREVKAGNLQEVSCDKGRQET